MSFLKVCSSLSHSFRSTGQYERVKGLIRYFQVIYQSSWRQQDVDHAFMNAIIEPRLGIIEPRLGIIESLMGRVEAHLGIMKPLLGKIELCFGTEEVKGLKKMAVTKSGTGTWDGDVGLGLGDLGRGDSGTRGD